MPGSVIHFSDSIATNLLAMSGYLHLGESGWTIREVLRPQGINAESRNPVTSFTN